MENDPSRYYPSLPEAFKAIGIMFLITLLGIPVLMLSNTLGADLAFVVYYVLVMGFSFIRIYDMRKKRIGVTTFDLFIDSRKIIFPLIITGIAIEFGLILPIISIFNIPDLLESYYSQEAEGRQFVFYFMLLVMAAPFFEELIFRGIILDGFLKIYDPAKAIFLSAFLFGAFHLNPAQIVGALILGIYIGWVYYHSRSVVLCMLLHAAYNFVGFLASLPFSKDIVTFDNSQPLYGGVVPALINIAIFLSIGAAGLRYLNKHFLEQNHH